MADAALRSRRQGVTGRQAMDWRYGPGEWPNSLPSDQPSADTVAAYARLLDGKLSRRNFDRDRGDTLWRLLNAEVAAGRLPGEEVELLRRDHDGAYSVPLARRYLDAGQATAVT